MPKRSAKPSGPSDKKPSEPPTAPSTSPVAGEGVEGPRVEGVALELEHPYGLTKAEAEQLATINRLTAPKAVMHACPTCGWQVMIGSPCKVDGTVAK